MDETNLSLLSKKQVGDELTKIALRQLSASNKYKKPLLEKWSKFEDLKAGKIKKKLRIQFSVPLPIFSGMLDTLAADFNESVELEFKQKNPADFFKAQKVQAFFNQQKLSTDKDAKWDYKSRIDKGNNIMCGRSVLKYYAYSDPKYHSVLENVHPTVFHCQPNGGGQLENHLFAGQEGILRTLDDIKDNPYYDKGQVQMLVKALTDTKYVNELTEDHKLKMAGYAALGLNPDNDSYIGETTLNLCEWVLTHKGERWYIVFDPWTGIWLRCEKLKDVFSLGLMPWTSWASFEDDKVFWTPAYADLIYPVAESVITLFNQELTNREKRNYNARAYDKEMFFDVPKLDAAQYRPDALVPVDTKGMARRISDGIYSFETPELQGTINLLDWVNQNLQRETGITDLAQGNAVQAQKKVNVAYIEQASVAKRIGYKSQSYTECWGEIGTRLIQGLKDHMTEPLYIEILGDMGMEPDVLTRDDLDTKASLGVEVISSTERKQDSKNQKAGRIEALKAVVNSPNINSEWRDASILRDIGGYSEDEIKLAMDTRNYASRESVAKAHICIQELLSDKTPNINYAADGIFLQIILDYAMEHRNKLGEQRFMAFTKYIADHTQLATANAQRRGQLKGMKNNQMTNQAMTASPQGRNVSSGVSPENTM